YGRALDARGAEQLAQGDAGPFGAARSAVRPLVAARLRGEERAAVAAAFEHHAPRHRTEPGPELRQRELEFLVHLALDHDFPAVGVARGLRNGSVVAD